LERIVQLKHPERQLELFGPADRHLRLLKQTLGVRITARRETLTLAGPEEAVDRACAVVQAMEEQLASRGSLAQDEVERLLKDRRDLSHFDADSGISVYSPHKVIKASTEGQQQYIRAMFDNDVTFCTGPAGTGKTYLAVAVAVSLLKRHRIRRIVLARPAVEAGEKLGFLPGDLQAKVNPYLRPLFDALEDMMEFSQMRKLMDLDIIEVIPLAFMRGRTLNEAVIICDEAQNTSPMQMLMVLTRLGHSSKMIITGDVTQTDLDSRQTSGLVEAIETLGHIKGIGVVELSRTDIVRHRLVQSIVRAYKEKQGEGTGPDRSLQAAD
jgi:phosphate starvation-inducible PhoH-like protein